MPVIIQGDFNEILGQSLEEYKKEGNRIASFSTYYGAGSALELARKGFFYKGSDDKIECFSCHKNVSVVSLRRAHQDALEYNQLHLPNCKQLEKNVPLYNRATVDLRAEHALLYIRDRAREIRGRGQNIQECREESDAYRIDSAIYNKPGSLDVAPTGSCPCNECIIQPEPPCCLYVREYGYITVPRAGLAILARRNIAQTGIAYPEYAGVEERIESFETRPGLVRSDVSPAEVFAEVGFFTTGSGDSVRCFYCDGLLMNWDPRADPGREHARWFPWCPFLRQEMGNRFIHDTLKMTKKIREGHEDRHQVIGSDVIQNVLQQGFPSDRIKEVIQSFFMETGFYPGHEALFDRLHGI